MAATFPHYTASSVPSNNTSLAQYAEARGLHVREDSFSAEEDNVQSRPSRIAHDPNSFTPINESTPLLLPPTYTQSSDPDAPRNANSAVSHDHEDVATGMFKHELWTLIRYALPVFGSVFILLSWIIQFLISFVAAEPMFLNTVSSLHLWYPSAIYLLPLSQESLWGV